MSSARAFAVETAAPIALILSEYPELSGRIVDEYLARGVEVRQCSVNEFFQKKIIPTDYDYVVVIVGPVFIQALGSRQQFEHWQSFTQTLNPFTGFYFVTPLSISAGRVGDFPARRAYFADYISNLGGYAPLLDQFLTECRDHKSITIPGDGLVPVRLLTTSEVGEGLKKWIFSDSQPSPFYCVAPQPDSLLNIGYQVRSALPYKVVIKFDDTDRPTAIPLDDDLLSATNRQIGWSPTGDYQSELAGYIDHFFAKNIIQPPPIVEAKAILRPQPILPNPSVVSATSSKFSSPPAPIFIPVRSKRPRLSPLATHLKKQKRPIPKKWAIAFASAVIAVFLYSVTLVTSGAIVVTGIKNIAQVDGSTSLSTMGIKLAKPAATYLQANITSLLTIPGFRGNTNLKSINKLLSAYLLALDTSEVAAEVAKSGKSIGEYMLSDSEGNIVADLNAARIGVGDLYDKLSLLDGMLSSEPPSVIPTKYKESYISAKSKIQEARRAALTGKSLLAAAPNILGVGDRRKYAVLFQNNMELRPTGGFIGSFAIISLENGKLFDIQVYDVYSADGQLKGHVEPPEEIKKYLGEANWFMRDSNWDPDFPTSARRAEWFLGKTLSQDVQGVIGINLYSLQDILRALGSVHVAEYNEDITPDNLFERAEYHAEINFFPGSTQKKEFIGSLADSVIEALKNVPSNKVLGVTRAIAKSIDEKNTTLAIDDTVSDRALSALGWNGELRTTPCPEIGTTCTSDYAMVVESNFGINKANYFVRRKLELNVVIQKDYSLSHELKIDYTNTAKSSAWPAGPYKNYSRLYLPEGSVISSVMIGQTILSSKDYKISVEHGRTVVGFLVEVPLNSSRSVIIDYSTPSNLSEHNSVYSLYWQKQSGTAPDPLSIHISYPQTLVSEIVSPKADYKPGSLDFGLTNVTDRRVMVKFK